MSSLFMLILPKLIASVSKKKIVACLTLISFLFLTGQISTFKWEMKSGNVENDLTELLVETKQVSFFWLSFLMFLYLKICIIFPHPCTPVHLVTITVALVHLQNDDRLIG